MFKKILFIGTLFLVTIWIWQGTEASENKLVVAFLDVGQGDAIFIETPNGTQVLVDSGVGSAVLRELGALMNFSDKSIDMIVATHPDADHVGGFPEVLERYDISLVVHNGAEGDSAVFDAFREARTHEGAREIVARTGMTFTLDENVYLKILYPDQFLEGNDGSIVAQLVYGDIEYLLTGDAPKFAEAKVVSGYGDALQSEVLHVGHHGSKTSTAEKFVAAVRPQYAVISAGKNNRYGHPDEETLSTLRKFDLEVLGTYERGTIVFETDGKKLQVRN